MAEFYTSESTDALPPIPDNLTVAQFMLDYQHEIRPARGLAPCLIDDVTGQHTSIEMIKERTEDLANGLFHEYNLGEQDTVMVLSPNHIDYPVAIWAIHKLGGIVTCSNPQLTVGELVYQLETAGVTFMLAYSGVLGVVLDAARAVGFPLNRVVLLDHPSSSVVPEDVHNVSALIDLGQQRVRAFCERSLSAAEGKTKVALLSWSSGTTGKPKAVAISHYAFIANIIQMAAHNQVGEALGHRHTRAYRPGDLALGVLPFYHVAGLVIGLHLAVFCAMTLVVVEKYDFSTMLDSISRHKISHLILVPPQAIAFCKHRAVLGHVLSMVKYVIIGAAPVSREVQEQLSTMFPSAHIGQAYGLTEMTTTLAMVSPKQRRGPLGSGGRLLPGIQARVVKPDGSFAQYGERGELIVKGPANALGYFNNPEATSETFIDGWVHTGDEVILTIDREVFVFDRLKEFMKVRGFQVAPAELEGCVLSHPDVADACVVGVPDDYSGELPLAYVVLSPTAADCVSRDSNMAAYFCTSIIKHVEERKAKFKRLTGGVRFVETIPKNGSGKILRRVLREDAKMKSKPPHSARARL